MSDQPDKESQTEEATEHKLETAREKGNVPISREAQTAVMLLGILSVIAFLLPAFIKDLIRTLTALIEFSDKVDLSHGADAMNLMSFVLNELGYQILSILLLMSLGAVAANVLQSPPSLNIERITPDWSKISIIAGFGRLVSQRNLFEFLKQALKLFVVLTIVGAVFYTQRDSILKSLFLDPENSISLLNKLLIEILSALLVFTICLAIGDIVWTQHHWRSELKMSRQELKDERKESDGDPYFKAKRRAIAAQRSKRRMMSDVPTATVVIANPTHYAIALRYRREDGGAPLVVAKGVDAVALRIRQLAENNGVLVFEDKPLARSLYKHAEIGQMIPEEFYRAIAEIIFVVERSKKASNQDAKLKKHYS